MAPARPRARAHRRTGCNNNGAAMLEPRSAQKSRRDLRILRGVIVALPLLGGVVFAQDGPDRSKPPVLASPTPLKLPAIAKRSLTNGLAIWVVESHEVPIVQL